MAASTSHNLEDSNEQPTYLTSRRKENNGKMLRNGPSPVEDIVKQAKERPGQLSVSKKNNEAKQSLAGSIELLEYFLRSVSHSHILQYTLYELKTRLLKESRLQSFNKVTKACKR